MDKQIEILEESEFYMKFSISGIDLAVANSLRRVMIAEIPTMAIDLVNIYVNSSPIHDEYISHRLGMIPLLSNNSDMFAFHRDCDCHPSEKCSKCRVFFTLHVRCEDEEIEVTSLHLIPEGNNKEVTPVKYKNIEGGFAGVPIVSLRKNQELQIECEAKKGIGKSHSKWSPVCIANLLFDPIIKLNDKINDLSFEQKDSFVKSCPKKVYELDPKSMKINIPFMNECIFCDDCSKNIDSQGFNSEKLITIDRSENKFFFEIETNGCLTAETVFKNAIRELGNKILEVQFGISGR